LRRRKNGMIWLEIISIRTAGIIEAGKVFDICRQMFQSIADEKLLELTVFCNARYATDISIHLQWKSDSGSGSILGRELSSALGDLGLISHTLWIEHEEVITGAKSELVSGKTTLSMTEP
jgi:hypothetical protein